MKAICPRWIRGNRGDLLSRLGILSALQIEGFKDLVVYCDKPQDIFPLEYKTANNGFLYNLIPSPKGFRELLKAEAVLWTAGLDLQDDSSLAKLLQTLILFYSYRLLGLKIYAIAQGAGPIATRSGRAITRLILNCVDGFLARDPGTYQLLKEIQPKANLTLGYDGIFLGDFDLDLITNQELKSIDNISTKKPGQPLIGFNLRQWFHFSSSLIPYQFARKKYLQRSQVNMSRFIAASVKFIEMLRHKLNARVVLVSAYEPGVQPWEDDLPWLQQIKAQFPDDGQVVLVEQPLSLLAFCGLISKLDVMIGTRLHTSLTALRFGVPAININYTLKGKDIYLSLGLDDDVIEIESFISNPSATINRIMNYLNGQNERNQIKAKIDDIIKMNNKIFTDFIGKINN